MKLEYRLEKQDYINFNMEYLVDSDIVRKFFFFQKIFIALTLFLGLFIIKKRYGVANIYLAIFYVLIYFSWSIAEGLLISFIMRKKLGNNIRENPKLIGDKLIFIKDDGIHDLSGKKEVIIKWKYVKFLEDVEDYLYVFTTLNSGYIIPRAALEGRELEFVESVNSKIGSKNGGHKCL